MTHRAKSPLLLALLLVLGAAADATGQATQPRVADLAVGDRVRTRVGGVQRTGTILSTDDSISIQSGDLVYSVPFEEGVYLSRSAGLRTRGSAFLRGAGYGLLIGGGSGLLIGFALGDDPPGVITFTAEQKALVTAIVLGAPGALIGGLVGQGRRERWERVPLDRPARVGLFVTPGGSTGIALTIQLRH